MNILVTGASGFLGKNLICQLHNLGYKDVFEYDKDTDIELLDQYCEECDFVFHLAGVNRPEKTDEFAKLLSTLNEYSNHAMKGFSSTIHELTQNFDIVCQKVCSKDRVHALFYLFRLCKS